MTGQASEIESNEPNPRAVRRKQILYWLRIGIGCYLCIMLTFTHWPRIELPRLPQAVPTDKVLHYIGYGMLGVLTTLVVVYSRAVRIDEGRPLRIRTRTGLVVSMLLVIAAYAVMDEVTQPLFHRKSDVFDGVADMLGAASGIGLVASWRMIRRRIRHWHSHDESSTNAAHF